MKLSIQRWIPLVAVTGVGLMLDSIPAAHSAGSFTDLNIEYGELKLALDAAAAENRKLREGFAESSKALSDTRQRLVEVSSETEIFKTQAMQLKLRMEAMGIGVVAGESNKLEQRLLAAVNQLRATSMEKIRVSEALVRLTEAASLYVKAESRQKPETRSTLEAEIRNSNSVLCAESATKNAPIRTSTIESARIIGLNGELSLVVVNVGYSSGIKSGMPMRVSRGERVIGSITVVDVREKLSGAVIQYLNSETKPIKIGDAINISTDQ